MRNPHAGEPFATSDGEIADALEDASIPTLMLSLVHMSGDPELIRGRLRPAGLFLMEPRVDRYGNWHRRTQEEISRLVWWQPSIKHSHFKNARGEIHTLSPWRLVDYWTWIRQPDHDDYVFS